MARDNSRGPDETAGSSLDGLFEVARTGRVRTDMDVKGPTSTMTDDLNQIIAENRRTHRYGRVRMGEAEEVRAIGAPRDSSMDDVFVEDGPRHHSTASEGPRQGGALGLDDLFGGGGDHDGAARKSVVSTLDDLFDKKS